MSEPMSEEEYEDIRKWVGHWKGTTAEHVLYPPGSIGSMVANLLLETIRLRKCLDQIRCVIQSEVDIEEMLNVLERLSTSKKPEELEYDRRINRCHVCDKGFPAWCMADGKCAKCWKKEDATRRELLERVLSLLRSTRYCHTLPEITQQIHTHLNPETPKEPNNGGQ
ncbi:hypothetical protein LCGC14_2226700 [marine sediment metagenome]|uniref:Uncharacterized protein n=1 Tax=marine sediment metagenome TaxID=412755 RepID=A0A0F9D9F6_9ZZZZ